MMRLLGIFLIVLHCLPHVSVSLVQLSLSRPVLPGPFASSLQIVRYYHSQEQSTARDIHVQPINDINKFLPSRSVLTRLSLSKSPVTPLPISAERENIPPKVTSIVNAALLVSGTTIGGGFLALPTITDPIGFIPSSVTLFGVWLYFLFQSFILVEAIQLTRQEEIAKSEEALENGKRQARMVKGEGETGISDEQSLSLTSSSLGTFSTYPGVSTVARNVFGPSGEIAIGLLLTILIEATLVSQISRAGLMIFNGQNYKLGCTLSSISIAILVFGPKRRGVEFASQMNSFLTGGFLLSTFSVFACGIKLANWNQLGLGSCFNTIQLRNIFNAIPTFLQLLVYGEIIPCVCELLDYNTKSIRKAVTFGSFLTLCLQISWSGLGIALLSSSTASGMIVNDVVTMLLQQGGIVRIPLISLAITAILTTILGSYLALLTMFNSIYVKLSSQRSSKDGIEVQQDTDTSDRTKSNSSSISLQQRLIVGSSITIPSLLIASTSPSIFLKAIDFAGSYPVLLLWGVIPPIMTLAQRFRRSRSKGVWSKKETIDSSGPSSWLAFLISISICMVGMNVKDDILSYLLEH